MDNFMKIVICAIARNEALYINDWIQYHLNLGFDEIHIFDNGNNGNILTDKRVFIYDYKNIIENRLQMKAYAEFRKNIDYDWCAFIDIDEFITLSMKDIHEFLSTFDKNVSVIQIDEIVYGDDNKIFPEDISIPVYDRFFSTKTKEKRIYKKLFLKNEPEMILVTPHDAVYNKGYIVNALGKKFQIYKSLYLSQAITNPCYIRHYKTKTLSEFCNQKLNTPRVLRQSQNRTIDYYFYTNEETPEKLEYIKNLGIST
jgi:hypothetical protein